MPRDNEVLGVVEQMFGASKMLVRCKDGKTRVIRIPKKLRRKHVWIKEGDVVIVKPWSVQGDEKGDVVWRYTRPQVNRLMNKGML